MREVPHLIKKALHIIGTALHIIKQIDIRQSWRSIYKCPAPNSSSSCFSRVTHDGDVLRARENWYEPP